jgi:hypothetical protein
VKLGSDSLAAAVLATFLALPLRADDADTRACPAIDPPASAVRSQAALRVFRDPETGQLRQPTREEAAELARAAAEAAQESEPIFLVVEHPDGMKSVDLQGALMQSVVVTRNADGSLTFRCVPAQLAAPPAAPVPQARPALEEK